MIKLNLHHYRNTKAFEAALTKASIPFTFEGYGVGLYDPIYEVETLPESLPNYIGKNVWIHTGDQEYPFNDVMSYQTWLDGK